MLRRLWMLAFFFLPVTGWAATEVFEPDFRKSEVKISADGGDWHENDFVCFVRSSDDKRVACGRVTAVSGKNVSIKLSFQKEKDTKGKTYYLERKSQGTPSSTPAASAPSAPTEDGDAAKKKEELRARIKAKKGRDTASTPASGSSTSTAKPSSSQGPDFNVTFGSLIGTTYRFPLFHFQAIASDQFALGLGVTYFSDKKDSSSISTYGGVLSGDYYFGSENFSGVHLLIGLGLYSFGANSTAGSEDSRFALAGIGTLGYRVRIGGAFNFNVGAGAQYISKPDITVVTLDSVGVLPLFTFDLGVAF